jgi:hypothetical protein
LSQQESCRIQINVTVVFPHSSLPTTTNGGFQNQEEFWKYVLEHQNGRWQTEMTVRPTTERERDYNDETFGDAFPLQFPYGHTGLQTDPVVMELKKRKKRTKSSLPETTSTQKTMFLYPTIQSYCRKSDYEGRNILADSDPVQYEKYGKCVHGQKVRIDASGQT